jgi:hypothetical protein
MAWILRRLAPALESPRSTYNSGWRRTSAPYEATSVARRPCATRALSCDAESCCPRLDMHIRSPHTHSRQTARAHPPEHKSALAQGSLEYKRYRVTSCDGKRMQTNTRVFPRTPNAILVGNVMACDIDSHGENIDASWGCCDNFWFGVIVIALNTTRNHCRDKIARDRGLCYLCSCSKKRFDRRAGSTRK